MNIHEEIIAAMLLVGPHDLQAIRRYIQWIKIRRMVNNHFYSQSHWVQPVRKFHWVGS